MKRAFTYFLLLSILLFTGCATERAQSAADAHAGLRALMASYEAGGATSDAIAILKGIDKYLPSASGVNSADWPEPQMTPEQIIAHPADYGAKAPPEPERWTWYAALTGTTVALLALLRVAGPLIPGGGPFIQGAANLAWTLMSTNKQKQIDQAATTVGQAAHTAKPLLDELRAIPLDQLPPSLRALACSPYIAAAIQHLADHQPPGAVPLPPAAT
jgi:hypothetical protein